jgi:hypothetical protein
VIIDMLTAYILANSSFPSARVDGYSCTDTAIDIEYSFERVGGGRKHLTNRISMLELLAFTWSRTK